jgi:S-adenosyl-L-methionine hydrolase (adenosine-forming)
LTMSIITLLTDFGTHDAYVGVMKGVILSINPSAVVIDVCHDVDPQDLIGAAYLITSVYRYFPQGTIHIVVVDPGVGGDRSIAAVKLAGHIFLTPDNGVLTLLMDENDIDAIVRVENPRYFLNEVSHTFHGRDIFAPVASHLSMGVSINQLGGSLISKDLVHLSIPKPYLLEKDELIGSIISIDHFGNCISNIDENRIKEFIQTDPEKTLEIKVDTTVIKSLSQSYMNAAPEDPVAVIGSFGFLEIAINCGNASRRLKVSKGDAVVLKLRPGSKIGSRN